MTLSTWKTHPIRSFFSTWQTSGRIYVRIFGLLRPHKTLALGALGCLILATVLALLIPELIAQVIAIGIGSGNLRNLVLISGAVLIASILRGLAAYGQGYLSQALSVEIAYDLRNQIYDHLQRLSFSFHDESETGQLMSRMTVDIEAVRNAFPLGFLRALIAILYFAAVAIILAILDLPLALVILLAVPILIALAIQVARRLRPMWDNAQQETGALSTIMQESLSGRRVVLSFVREAFEITKFEAKNQELRNLKISAQRLSAWNQPLMVLSLNLVTVLVLWVGGTAVISQRVSLPTLVAVIQYALLLGTPVRSFGFMITWLMRARSSGHRIFEVLDTEPVIKDAPNAIALRQVAGHVRFEGVGFAYGSGPRILDEINIDAQPGQVIALLGTTGSGKSTILSLLPRFYDVTEGRITVDGHDIRAVQHASLRRSIGFVLQDVFLFNATLRENIAFGAPHATEEQIIAAAKVARLHDFACTLPDGYETWVGERGVTLSGGQKQRVAIARTILFDPRILVLDDATSSVDMETEYLIQEALDAVMRGRTSFVVASRLRTIKRADQILVLDRGRIIERGTHDTLLALDGTYARLYELQLREQEEYEAQALKLLDGEKPAALTEADTPQQTRR
ncbi:MAG TPA: ABC transporter ATP-binding protein [Ktedonobacterales bacterium]